MHSRDNLITTVQFLCDITIPSIPQKNYLSKVHNRRESILLPYTVSKISPAIREGKPSCSAVKGTVEWTNKHQLAQPIWSALSVYYFIQTGWVSRSWLVHSTVPLMMASLLARLIFDMYNRILSLLLCTLAIICCI